MRSLAVILLAGLCAFALAAPQQTPTKEFLQKQKDILRLYYRVNQPSYFQDHIDVAKSYTIHGNYEKYTQPQIAKNYYRLYKNGLLPQGQVFSVFFQPHLDQAIALYKLFYYAQDYETFYNTAVWARQHVNEGVYLYALSVAIVHRSDTVGIVIPPIYEVYPYYFYNNDVIQEAYQYQQGYHSEQHGEEVHQGQQSDQKSHETYTINANYSGYYLNLHPEQSLSYFTEDVGLNAFYYYYNIYYPYWLGDKDFDYSHDRRGELYYFIYQQILARYYLERLSNGFGEIPHYNYEVPFETGYYSSLQYANGLPFPVRPNYANLYEYFYNYGQRYGNNRYAYSYTLVQDFERRIRDAIDLGFVYDKEGQKISLQSPSAINVLGNLIESNPDSPNAQYYGALQVFARHLLGYSYQPLSRYQVVPSALEHFETSLRDPAFYQFYRRIVLYFQKYQATLPFYSEQDLAFEGVKITNVDFDRLVTYFDYFYSDISNAVFVSPQQFQNHNVHIRTRQSRLNQKPFNYKIVVNSKTQQKATVRIYIGPKYDEYGRYLNISQNRLNYFYFDAFTYDLQAGENIIQRNSHQNNHYEDDRLSFSGLYKQVQQALDGDGQASYTSQQSYFGFPRRFLLPKGTEGGFEYQFYVIVSPYVQYEGRQTDQEGQKSYRPGSGGQRIDNYPLGYPFERPAYYDQVYFNIPNSYVYSAKIYHRSVADINASSASQKV